MTRDAIVYVLDDDRRIRNSLEMLLSSAGYRVRQFSDPDAFLTHVRPDVPSCLVLDLDLGDTTGLEVQKMLIDDAALPVIFLTGFGEISTVVEAMKGGRNRISFQAG